MLRAIVALSGSLCSQSRTEGRRCARGQPTYRTAAASQQFAGFYFGGIIDALRSEGFRVVVPDQIGYGRSSKPIMPYNLADMARNTRAVLQSRNISKVFVVGHSMGGMLAARFATQYPDMVERLVLYNPIGLTDARFRAPAVDPEAAYKQVLASTYETIRDDVHRTSACRVELPT